MQDFQEPSNCYEDIDAKVAEILSRLNALLEKHQYHTNARNGAALRGKTCSSSVVASVSVIVQLELQSKKR